MDISVPPPEPCASSNSFPEDLSAVSNQELERLHVRASRDVDFEYFFEGHCSDATRTRYQQLNKELHRRNHTANADPPTRQEPIARFPEANGTSRD